MKQINVLTYLITDDIMYLDNKEKTIDDWISAIKSMTKYVNILNQQEPYINKMFFHMIEYLKKDTKLLITELEKIKKTLDYNYHTKLINKIDILINLITENIKIRENKTKLKDNNLETKIINKKNTKKDSLSYYYSKNLKQITVIKFEKVIDITCEYIIMLNNQDTRVNKILFTIIHQMKTNLNNIIDDLIVIRDYVLHSQYNKEIDALIYFIKQNIIIREKYKELTLMLKKR